MRRPGFLRHHFPLKLNRTRPHHSKIAGTAVTRSRRRSSTRCRSSSIPRRGAAAATGPRRTRCAGSAGAGWRPYRARQLGLRLPGAGVRPTPDFDPEAARVAASGRPGREPRRASNTGCTSDDDTHSGAADQWRGRTRTRAAGRAEHPYYGPPPRRGGAYRRPCTGRRAR